MAYETMKAQAGARRIGSFVKVNEHGKSRLSSHYGDFAEFVRRIERETEAGYSVEQIVFDGNDAMDACKNVWSAIDSPLDPAGYARRVAELEGDGLTTGDAQGVAMAENMRRKSEIRVEDLPF